MTTCEQPIRYVAGTHGPVPVRCAQSRYLHRWTDTTGHEHLACPRHLAKRTHLYPPTFAPEPAVPGVFVSEAEARELWDAPESADPVTAAKAEHERALA